MFVGHYAAAFAAKAIEPKAPLWATVAGAQLVDIGWSVLVMAGVERVRVDTDLMGSPLVLEHMPWTHSLPAAIAWSLAAMLLAKPLLRLSWFASALIGAVVLSHWMLDLVVHRPDLALWPGGPKVGFGFWNVPVSEQALEIGLIAVAGVFWGAARHARGQSAWPAAAFIAGLVAMQAGFLFLSAPTDPVQLGLGALIVYLLVTAFAIPVDKHPSSS